MGVGYYPAPILFMCKAQGRTGVRHLCVRGDMMDRRMMRINGCHPEREGGTVCLLDTSRAKELEPVKRQDSFNWRI
jgi:hypothetical protein